MRIPVRLAVVSLLAVASAARADDCAPPGAPTGCAAVIETYMSGNVEHKTVHVTWTNPAVDFSHLRLGYRMERRVKGAPNWTVWARNLPISSSDGDCAPFCGTYNAVRDDTSPCLNGCVDGGQTLEYRVVIEYAYKQVCSQYDGGGFTHETAPSNAAEVAIPAPPAPPPKAPKNVRAVANLAKNQIRVEWSADGPAPADGWVLERKEVASGPAKTKADDGEWEHVADVLPKHLFAVDKRAASDAEYLYRVAARVAEQKSYGAEDRIYRRGACPPSRFKLWTQVPDAWSLEETELAASFSADGAGLVRASVSSVRPGEGDVPVFTSPTSGLNFDGDPDLSFPVVILAPSGPFQALAQGAKGTFTVRLDNPEPFDRDALLSAAVTAKFGKTKFDGRIRRSIAPLTDLTTTVCGSLAASKQKSETVKVGQVVTFVFRLVALGPSPLLSRRVRLAVSIEGGVIVSGALLSRDNLHEEAPFVGESTAGFEVGAIGAVAQDRSEQAILALRVAADRVPADGQLRVRVIPVAVASDAEPKQTVTFAHTGYIAELLVAAPKPAK